MRLLPLSRPPLNGRQARTMREANRDPMDWWEPPPSDPPEKRDWSTSDRIVTLFTVALLVLAVVVVTYPSWAAWLPGGGR